MSWWTETTHDAYTDTYFQSQKTVMPKSPEVNETTENKEIGRLILPNNKVNIYRKKLGY